jgi:hypothetical protein
MGKNYNGIEALGLALVGSLAKDYKLAFQKGDKPGMDMAKDGLKQYSAALPCSVDEFCELIETHVDEI